MSPVAVLGLGAMGKPIARRLAITDHDVRAWNRTPGRADLAGSEIVELDTPTEAVREASIILTVLADDEALTGLFCAGPHRLAANLAAGQLVVNLGTVSSAALVTVATAVSHQRAALIDAGMLGNARHAELGELRFYVGGEAEQCERARPVLKALAKEVTHVGPLGAGMDLKLILNLLMGLEMQALAEVVALGEELGLDRRTVLATVSNSGFSAPVMGFKAKRMAMRHYSEPDFRLALMSKDLGLVDTAAAAHGLSLPMTRAAYQAHRAACATGWADYDCAAITDAIPGPAVTVLSGQAAETAK